MELSFGLGRAVPAAVETAWGARFIFPDDMLPDRQGMAGTPENKQALLKWLNGGAGKKARETARKASENYHITKDGSQQVILYQDKQGVIVACPNASYGYLYVAAWLHNEQPELQPLPEYKELPKMNSRRTTTKNFYRGW